MTEYLILVDENDIELGKAEKLSAHEQGLLHKAFSIFIFNHNGELLLQQRSASKYHSAELWSNSCCSHPRHGENTDEAAKRRLLEEIGLQCDIQFAFSFIYKAQFANGLTEHEFDHVYFGYSDDEPILNADEVKNWKYISSQELSTDILQHPERYTEWLKICLPKVIELNSYLKSKSI